MLISASSLVSSLGQLPAHGFSHHDLIYLSYTLKLPKSPHKVRQVRSYRHTDIDKLHADAAKLDWTSMGAATDVKNKVRIFSDAIINLYNTHAPVTKVKLKHARHPG